MSEVLRPYLVDLEKVQKACGSKDSALISTILTKQAAYIADYEKQSRFDVENVTRNRLSDLINGNVYPTGFAYLYGYCLELLCRQFGKLNHSALFEDFHSPFLEKVRDLSESVGRRRRRPDKKKPATLAITVARTGVSTTCDNIAFYQLQTALASMTGQGGFADPEQDWLVSGDFSGADYLAIIRNALASINLEAVTKKTVYGDALIVRSMGQGTDGQGYRLKGLDFEVRRYPVPIPQYDDYPQISFLAREEFEQELEALKNKEFSSKEPIVNNGRKQYSTLIKKAARLNCDIVFFI